MGLPRAEMPLALLLLQRRRRGRAARASSCWSSLLERAFRVLEIRWPRLVEALPGYAVGSLGAFWTIQRLVMLLGGAR